MQQLMTIAEQHWQSPFSQTTQDAALHNLESGQVIQFPALNFQLDETERALLQTSITHPNAKNISYDATTLKIKGTAALKHHEMMQLEKLMKRYNTYCKALVGNLLKHYTPALRVGRTSLRTCEAEGRTTSPKKDDNRLHVDTFPATPMGDQRILRVFSNINPDRKPRVWHIGESFNDVVQNFLPRIKPPLSGIHKLLKLCKITKSERTLYDHYMLNIHDKMKLDNRYQQQVPKIEVKFPAGSSWIVFSDITSHAAISGQYMMEQTFYLPYTAMQDPKLSPQAILNRQLALVT